MPPKVGSSAADDVHELVRVALVELDVKAIETGELLEQDSLAFHYGFARQRPDRAQTQHGGAVGDHANQIAARGQVPRLGRIADDLVAGGGDSRRIGQRKIALVGKVLGGEDRNLARRIGAVVLERTLADILVRHKILYASTELV